MPKVTASKVHSLAKEPGRHNAGGSLYLVVKGGSALWEYQFRKAKVLRSAVLGSPRGAPAVSLQEAREKAMEIRKANREERKTGVPAMPRVTPCAAHASARRAAAAARSPRSPCGPRECLGGVGLLGCRRLQDYRTPRENVGCL
jgi:hypothetical protein